MSYVVEKIAGILKAAREQRGMSQRDLSALAGVPQSHISRIEKKEVDLRISSLAAIAHALGLELMLVPITAEPAVKVMTGLGGLSPLQQWAVANAQSKTPLQELQELEKRYTSEAIYDGLAGLSSATFQPGKAAAEQYNAGRDNGIKPKWRLGDEDNND